MKIIIVDDGFTGWVGHNAEYNLAIFDELARRKINCQIFAQNSVLQFAALALKAKPAFTHTAERFSLHSKILPKFIYKLILVFFTNASHLLNLMQKVTSYIDDQDLLLIGDFSLRTSIAYSVWLFYLTVLRKKLSVVVLMHEPLRYPYSWHLLKLFAHFHRLALAAQNQAIADICSMQTNLKCAVFPTPQTLSAPNFCASRIKSGSEVAIAFLGVTFIEKGFDLLVEEISLLKSILSEKKITLTIQYNITCGSPALDRAKDKLFGLAKSVAGLKVIEGVLPMTQFLDTLCSADILIFPYQPEIYKYTQSGVFTQALTLGKVVIVTEGTFIASELIRYGSGIAFRFGVPGALTEAIKTAVSNIGTMQEKARKTKDLYYQIHNPSRYVDLLLELGILENSEVAK